MTGAKWTGANISENQITYAGKLSEKEVAAWEHEHMAYMQTVPEVFHILHYVTIMDLKKK